MEEFEISSTFPFRLNLRECDPVFPICSVRPSDHHFQPPHSGPTTADLPDATRASPILNGDNANPSPPIWKRLPICRQWGRMPSHSGFCICHCLCTMGRYGDLAPGGICYRFPDRVLVSSNPCTWYGTKGRSHYVCSNKTPSGKGHRRLPWFLSCDLEGAENWPIVAGLAWSARELLRRSGGAVYPERVRYG